MDSEKTSDVADVEVEQAGEKVGGVVLGLRAYTREYIQDHSVHDS